MASLCLPSHALAEMLACWEGPLGRGGALSVPATPSSLAKAEMPLASQGTLGNLVRSPQAVLPLHCLPSR